MRRRSTSVGLIGAVAGLVWLAVPVHAQTSVELEVTPFTGGTLFLTDLPNQFHIQRRGQSDLEIQGGHFEDSFTLGANAGVRLDDRFGIEAFVAWIPTQLAARSGVVDKVDVDGFMYGLTFLYHFDLDLVRPFLGVGAGAETFDYNALDWNRHTDFMTNLVVGANLEITPSTALRFEARDCITWFDPHVSGLSRSVENDLMLTVGLDWRVAIAG